MKEVIPVLAGRIKEFHSFVQEKLDELQPKKLKVRPGRFETDDKIYFYISDHKSLYGVRFKSYVAYGTYYKRHDLERIMDEIHARIRINGN